MYNVLHGQEGLEIISSTPAGQHYPKKKTTGTVFPD